MPYHTLPPFTRRDAPIASVGTAVVGVPNAIFCPHRDCPQPAGSSVMLKRTGVSQIPQGQARSALERHGFKLKDFDDLYLNLSRAGHSRGERRRCLLTTGAMRPLSLPKRESIHIVG